jgi:hypothetical protein
MLVVSNKAIERVPICCRYVYVLPRCSFKQNTDDRTRSCLAERMELVGALLRSLRVVVVELDWRRGQRHLRW